MPTLTQMSYGSERLTRTGPLREGFDYQDLFGVAVLIEWLEHPGRYKWVKFEADEFGSLDDVTRCTPENHLFLTQIKHSGNPETPGTEFTLADMLAVPSGASSTRRSLFQKWFRSWREAAQSPDFTSVKAELITNRRAPTLIPLTAVHPATGALMIDPDKVASASPEEWKQLVEQAKEAEEIVRRFFSALEFRFDSPEMQIQCAALQRRASNLGITDKGYENLEKAAKHWTIKRDVPGRGGLIQLQDVRVAASWFVPRGLDQQFEVPSDFVPFGGVLLAGLIETFKDVKGGVRVFSGSPGAGKSTFLSDLYNRTKQAGIACIRHHYFLQRHDPEGYNRLEYARASEAILHDLLREVPDSVPDLNPSPADLSRIITTTAKSLASQGKTLVLVVDGLDHVLRDSDVFELRVFLKEVLPSVKGLWVLLGTRPLQEASVSSLLSRTTTPDDWVEIPRFGYDQCRSLLKSNAETIHISDHEFDESVATFLDTTQGHPLHARYVLEALKRIGKKGFVTSGDISRIPPYGSDLVDFYERLWQSLTYEAKEVAILVSLASFGLTSDQTVEILTPVGRSAAALLGAIDDLTPFLNSQSRYVELFHASFGEFIRNTREYSTVRSALLSKLADWLQSIAPEPLRWAHLSRVRYFCGDPAPLLETVNRSWAASAFAEARPADQVIDQIEWARHAAMERREFGRAFLLGQLADYIRNSWNFDQELWDRIDALARRVARGTCVDPFQFEREAVGRSPRFLRELTLDLSRGADVGQVDRVLTELGDRLRRRRWRDGELQSDILPTARALAFVAALARAESPRVVQWAQSFRQMNQSAELLSTYTEALADAKRFTALRQLTADSTLTVPERNAVIANMFRSAAMTGIPGIQAASSVEPSIWARLHAALAKQIDSAALSDIPPATALPASAKEYDRDQEATIADVFERVYLESFLSGTLQRDGDVELWRGTLNKAVWSHEAAGALARFAVSNAKQMENAKPAALDLGELIQLSPVLFPEHRDQWGVWQGFRIALKRVLATHINLRFRMTGSKVDDALLASLMQLELLSHNELTEVLLKVAQEALCPHPLTQWIEAEVSRWMPAIETFPERSGYYLDLAELAYKINDATRCRTVLRRAILNCLGYGYHKDLAIYESIEAVNTASQAGSTRGREWLARLSPIARETRGFTDADETSRLLVDLVSVCSGICPDALHAIYISLSEEERVYLAEDVLPYLVGNLDLSDPFARALALTAIDEDSRRRLQEKAEAGDEIAASVSVELIRIAGGLQEEERASVPKIPAEALDTSGVDSRNFAQKVVSLKSPYEQGRFGLAWFREQIRLGKERPAYFALKSWMQMDDFYMADPGLLLEMVPYADEFESSNEGFDLLCKAAPRAHGWSRFFSDRKLIRRMWDALEQRYPRRWLDYVYTTLRVSAYGSPLQKQGSLPGSEGTAFMARFGTLADVEDLAEASVKNIEDLMADLTLPQVDWFEIPRRPLDSLLSRLFWISATVRERAARLLAKLIVDTSTSEEAFEAIIERLAAEQLESRVIVLLLPILRAVRAGATVSLDRVASAVKRPSLVSEKITSEIELALQRRGS